MDERIVYKSIESWPGYLVGGDGSIWSNKGRGWSGNRTTPKWFRVNPVLSREGYGRVCLSNGKKRKCFFIHHLVLDAFVGLRPDGHHGCHNDGIPLNNEAVNLRWDTPKGNMADKIKHGTAQLGIKHPGHILIESEVLAIKRRIAKGEFDIKIGAEFNMSPTAIWHIRKGHVWKHIHLDEGD